MRYLHQLLSIFRLKDEKHMRQFVVIQIILALLMVGVGILLFLIVTKII